MDRKFRLPMRKLIIILFIIASALLSKGQFDMLPVANKTGTNYRGVWGYGGNTVSADISNYASAYGWKGYQLLTDWNDVETSDNVFNWTTVDSRINTIISAGLVPGVEFMVGQACPAWLQTLAGTFTTTVDTYPKYYNPVYEARYWRFLRKVTEHLSSRGDLIFWQVTEGTTGDEGAYHGSLTSGVGDPYVPQDPNDDDWQAFRHEAWDSVKNDVALYPISTHLLFNTGNNAYNVDLIASGTYGDAWG